MPEDGDFKQATYGEVLRDRDYLKGAVIKGNDTHVLIANLIFQQMHELLKEARIYVDAGKTVGTDRMVDGDFVASFCNNVDRLFGQMEYVKQLGDKKWADLKRE
jgi:hypothetical protein